MSKGEILRTQTFYDAIGKWLDGCLRLFRRIVDKHARPLALINKDDSTDLLLNDYVYYCITKSCKSLQAITFLINSGLPEDAIILLRSVYENYLSTAYVIQNPDSVRDFIYTRVALAAGHLEHPLTKKGRPDKRKLFDKKTGLIYDFDCGIGDLSRGSGHSYDSQLYNAFYSYLCEHAHPNMIGSGNYRDESDKSSVKYSYSDTDNLLAARFYTLLVMTLFCQELLRFPKTPQKIRMTVQTLSRKGTSLLLFGINTLDFERIDDIQAAISNLIKFLKNEEK